MKFYTNPSLKLLVVIAFLVFLKPNLAQVFTKVTTGPAVNEANNSYNAAWADYDNDGDLDLFHSLFFAAPNNPSGNNLMYQNNCNGNFTRISQIPGGLVSDGITGTHSCWVDYDNDGDQDLYVGANFLYQNQGNGSFVKIVTNISSFTPTYTSASFADFDNDGLLDMYNGMQNLYKNNGNNNFTTLNIPPFDSIPFGYMGDAIAWVDYDNDGFMDIYLCNAYSTGAFGPRNYLFHNNGNSTFTENNSNPDLTTAVFGYGCAWGDIDNDGDLDVWVNAPFSGGDRLMRNDGNGIFTRLTTSAVSLAGGVGQAGASFADYDNDGDLDLMIPNFGQNFLFANDGLGNFTQITNEIIVNDTPVESYAAAWADYDNDGDLDLFVPTAFGNPNDNLYVNNVYENNIANTAWMKFKLNGTTSNKNGVGARIYAKATINGISKWQFREVNINTTRAGESGGASGQIVHLGFGNATIIDSLKIVWPASNTIQVFTNVALNQSLKITEGSNALSNLVPLAKCTADLPVKNPAIISGKLYKDVNNNCVFDVGDEPIANKAVQASSGNYYGFSDNSGNYTIKVPAGNYSINVTPQNDNWENNTCQVVTTYTANSTNNGQLINNLNFSLRPKSLTACGGKIGLRLNSLGIVSQDACNGVPYFTPCPGVKHRYCAPIVNNTTNTLTAPNYLTMSFPPGINLDGASVFSLNPLTTILNPQTTPNVGTFTITTNLVPGSTYTVCVEVNVSPFYTTVPVVSTVEFNNTLTPAINLVQNPGFESGNTGFTTSYTFNNCLPSILEGVYCIGNDPSLIISGWGGASHTGNNFMFAGGVPNKNIWCQTVSVQTQTVYSVGAFVNNILTPAFPNYPEPNLSIFVNGISITSSGNVPQPPSNWVEMTNSWCSDNNTSANVCIRNTKPSGGGNDFGLDDIYVKQEVTAPFTLTENVLCSCDPNDKAVNPIGCGANGNIKKNETLTYKIRFQNTGNGPANNILLRDELDADLDINTLRIITASHTITDLQIIPNNVLVVKFDSIFLPSINIDEQASQGFLLFEIKPKHNLEDGTQIQNQGGIYFDENEVVLTNSVLNTLWDNPYPNANFTYKHNCSNTGLAYDFNYTGSTSGATYFWEFQNASSTTSTAQNPSNIIFNGVGYKMVRLTVNLNGCTDVFADSILVESVFSSNGKKIIICHNGKSKEVSINALQAHLNHGDCVGFCPIIYANKKGIDDEIVVQNNSFEAELLLNIMPNPANEEVYINIESTKGKQTHKIELYNYAGVLILVQNNIEQNTKIETTQLPTGIYILRTTSSGGLIKTNKLFIQH